MVFHKSSLAFSASTRFTIEIVLDQGADFGFGLGQCDEVGARIQPALSVAADHPVLPKRKSSGVILIHSRNADIGCLLRIEHVNMAKIAGVERELDLSGRPDPPPQLAQFGTVIFQPFQFNPIMEPKLCTD